MDADSVCATCGRPLTGLDPNEDELGDAGLRICGQGERERDFLDLEIEMRGRTTGPMVDLLGTMRGRSRAHSGGRG